MKRILFISGTRADFGKIKPLIIKTEQYCFDVHVFVTGMHMLEKYGLTYKEIEKTVTANIYKYINHVDGDSMDRICAKTVHGLSDYVHELKPDMIVVHGDRVEALAGAIVGSLNNILVTHIEGGELSGTVDELIRHAVSKLSHIHFVSNADAKERLGKMGEDEGAIFEIGSPDIDVMLSKRLPSIEEVKSRYEIIFNNYGILIFHPVTTEIDLVYEQAANLVEALDVSGKNWVVILPNNDHGSELINQIYKKYINNERFKFIPSMRFEYFLTLLKNSALIVGNSSCGIREAPFYGRATINVGSRQNGRLRSDSVFDVDAVKPMLLEKINELFDKQYESVSCYGDGKSSERFVKALKKKELWCISKQKIFCD